MEPAHAQWPPFVRTVERPVITLGSIRGMAPAGSFRERVMRPSPLGNPWRMGTLAYESEREGSWERWEHGERSRVCNAYAELLYLTLNPSERVKESERTVMAIGERAQCQDRTPTN